MEKGALVEAAKIATDVEDALELAVTVSITTEQAASLAEAVSMGGSTVTVRDTIEQKLSAALVTAT